jgi:cell division protein FtsB
MFLIMVMALMIFPMARDIISYIRMAEEYDELQIEHQELITLQQQLEEEREALYTKDMVERLAREELDLVLPGESKVYQAIPINDIPERQTLRAGEALH